jgi:hypothetical protein
VCGQEHESKERCPEPPLTALDDVQFCALPDPRLDIEGVTQEGALEVGYGPSDAGKSTLYAGRACCLATGRDWHGFKILRSGPVVVLVFEGMHAFKKKIRAWKAANGFAADEPIGVYVVDQHVNFLDQVDVFRLVQVMRGTHAIELIVDTLAQSIGADEDNDKMQTAVTNAAMLRRLTGARVVFIHHTGKNRKRGARGGTALTAAADTVLSLDEEKEAHVLRCVRQRDGERFLPVFLKLSKTPDGSTVLFERRDPVPAALISDRARERAKLHELILSKLRDQPGMKASDVVKAVHKNKADVLRALDELKTANRATFERSGRKAELWSCVG